jgi:hypothetical protein
MTESLRPPMSRLDKVFLVAMPFVMGLAAFSCLALILWAFGEDPFQRGNALGIEILFGIIFFAAGACVSIQTASDVS